MKVCATCSAPVSDRVRVGLCRSCYLEQMAEKSRARARSCAGCGSKLHPATRGELCLACHHKTRTIPVPADFAQRAAQMSGVQIAGHYGVSNTAVKRWITETGIRPARADARPVPDDLARHADVMTVTELAEHYGIDRKSIGRWCRIAGVTPFRRRQERRLTPQRLIPRAAAYAGPKSAFTGLLRHDDSLEGRAADHLRCATRAAIYRCNERGAVPERKSELTHWRYGNVVIDADELLRRAERHGFQARWAA